MEGDGTDAEPDDDVSSEPGHPAGRHGGNGLYAEAQRAATWVVSRNDRTREGRRSRLAASPNGYVGIEREWRTGDVVDVRLPMTLRAEALPGAANLVAFAYGPIVLAGRLGH